MKKAKLWKVKAEEGNGLWAACSEKTVNAPNLKKALQKACTKKGSFRLQNIVSIKLIGVES